MPYKYNKKLIPNAQKLRRNMTEEEKHLWYDLLKRLPVTVKRQQNIGDYIVDFYIAKKKTVIELDGSQHGRAEHAEADKKRDEYLGELGITVLRYKNTDINQRFNVVCNDILKRFDMTADDLKVR